MSYHSSVTGELTCKPGLPGTPANTYNGTEHDLVITQVTDEKVGFVDGEVTVIGSSWSVITLREIDEYRADDLEANVVHICSLAKQTKCMVNGILNVAGENPGDLWRVRVVDNEVFAERPKLIWPNGDTEEL